MRGIIAVFEGSLSPVQSQELLNYIDADGDGNITVLEVQKALKGNILQMEPVILKLLDQVKVPMPTRNFADFMIFVTQRKKDTPNKIRSVFEVGEVFETMRT